MDIKKLKAKIKEIEYKEDTSRTDTIVDTDDVFQIIDELAKDTTIISDVSDTLIAWEQFKKANWYESEAIDVEKMLMDKFQAIYGR